MSLNLPKVSIICLLFSILISGCNNSPKYRIGVSQCSEDDWRRKMNEEIEREAMLHEDIEVTILSANDDSERQAADLRRFVKEGYDIIIAAPNESKTLTPVVEEIYASGIPIVLFDRRIDTESYTAFQGADNAAIGRLAANSALNLGGSGTNVLEIRGLKGSSPENGRHEGFVAEANRLGLNIVGSDYGDWTAERAAPIADSMLRRHPETNVVYAHNDRMAIAAAEAAKALGRNDIKIIGIDAARLSVFRRCATP